MAPITSIDEPGASPEREPAATSPAPADPANRRPDLKHILVTAAAPAFADQGRSHQQSQNDRRDNHTGLVVKHDNKPLRDTRFNGRRDGSGPARRQAQARRAGDPARGRCEGLASYFSYLKLTRSLVR